MMTREESQEERAEWYKKVSSHCLERLRGYIEIWKAQTTQTALRPPSSLSEVIDLVSKYNNNDMAKRESRLIDIQEAAMRVRRIAAWLAESRTATAERKAFSALYKLSNLRTAWDLIMEFKTNYVNETQTFRIVPVEKTRTRPIHCEMMLASHFLNNRVEGERYYRFIGCSKLCCVCCWMSLKVNTPFDAAGCHYKIYRSWAIPPGTWDSSDERTAMAELTGFLHDCRNPTFGSTYNFRHAAADSPISRWPERDFQ